MASFLKPSGRLVLTGHDGDGRSTFTGDEVVPSIEIAGGGVQAQFFWGRDDVAEFPDKGQRQELRSSQPPPGGCRFATLTIPAGGNDAYHRFIPAALGDLADPSETGFHSTPTLDFIFVVDGVFKLELDDGEARLLSAGDTAILNGVRHRWSNPGPGDATLLAAQVGAEASVREGRILGR